ncbi:MAG TPA: hypothetical protein VFA70_09290 [Dehalococcoidia bacterium]|nr:hypothetical protein [Dehalococcoidia bacterium]
MSIPEARRLHRIERAALRRDAAAFDRRLHAWPDRDEAAAWERVSTACAAVLGCELTMETLPVFHARFARDAAFRARVGPAMRAYYDFVARRFLGSDGDNMRTWLAWVTHWYRLLYEPGDAGT